MPFYTVRFNTLEDIATSGVSVGDDVFYAPKEDQFTHYVFVQQLQKLVHTCSNVECIVTYMHNGCWSMFILFLRLT